MDRLIQKQMFEQVLSRDKEKGKKMEKSVVFKNILTQ